MLNDALFIDLWDVGQGDCSVIHLPDGRLLIIDVGPIGSPLVDWLKDRHPLPGIAAIILTHNDADHSGALPAIIDECKSRIQGVWMLLDRSATDKKFQKIFRSAAAAEDEGWFSLRQVTDGQVIWSSSDNRTLIKIVHPGFSQNIAAITSGQPNNASGMIVLEVDGNRLCTWPGDLELEAVAAKHDRKTQLLVGPHHGGPTDYPTKTVRRKLGRNSAELKGRARDAVGIINPSRSFISVGTKNQYSHPRPGFIKLLAQNGSHVVCTQLTGCCERGRLQSKSHVFQGSAMLGLRACKSGVSCRGSMRFYVKNGELEPDEYDSIHRQRVNQLLRPQCLRV